MDREQLRNQAAARRNLGEEPKRRVAWDCGYCSRSFASEGTFMNHRCREKERIDEMQSPRGQTAYLYYGEWLKAQRRKAPPIETFVTSKFYSTFLKFTDHASKTHIPNPLNFIKVMTQDGVSPALWSRDEVYSAYLKSYDASISPTEQVLSTIEFISQLCVDYECEPHEIFSNMKIDRLATLIKERKLSPWLLLASKVFRDWLRAIPPNDSDIIKQSINVGAMSIRIQEEAKSFAEFGKVAQEIGL